MGIKVHLSTAFYLETNRHSEIANQKIERYFYTFINYYHDDWSKKLAMTKFAANKNELASTKLSPFFVFQNLHPRISFDIVDFFNVNISKQIHKQKTLNIFGNI